MKKYQYQLVRYVHDHFTGEFVNIGIVLYAQEDKFLKGQFIQSFNRVTHMFPGANSAFLKRSVHQIEQSIEQIAAQLNELFLPSNDLAAITQGIFQKEDSGIQFGPINYGIDLQLDAALNRLFQVQIDKYIIHKADSGSMPDEDVWKKCYKAHFEKYGILHHLNQHKVSIPKDVLVFDRAWKNDIWHCFEPLSFKIKEEDAIKDKVYKWAGKLKGLAHADEKIHLVLMASIDDSHITMKPFIEEYLNINTEQLKVEFITDEQADDFARQLSEKISEHDN